MTSRIFRVAAPACVAVAALLLSVLPAKAQTFNFEDTAATGSNFSSPGALNVLVLNSGGLTMTLSREGGATFDIHNNASQPTFFPGSFGNRSLAPFSNTGNFAFVANFSSLLSSFQISAGDFGDDADMLTLNAWSGLNGTGTLLSTVTLSYGLGTFPGDVLTAIVAAAGIQSVTFIGGSTAFPNSLYYDNIIVTQQANGVPETGSSVLLLLLSCAVMFFLARRRIASARA